MRFRPRHGCKVFPCLRRRFILAFLLPVLLLAAPWPRAMAQGSAVDPVPPECSLLTGLAVTRPFQAGPTVLHLQQTLLDLGFSPGPLDGIYGPRTAAAVAALQQHANLVPDGRVGPRTLAALAELLQRPPHAPYLPGEQADRLIIVHTRRQSLTLVVGGYPVKSYPVAVGRPRTPSPIGIWQVTRKAKEWGGGFGSRWLGLNVPWGIYGIHGTNKPWALGQRVSAGCVRMRNRDVEELYELVPLGTTVIIYGDPVFHRRALVEGHTGTDVMELQVRLHELGFYAGPLDGRFGPGTLRAVRRFQESRGLAPSGVVRWDTFRALGLVD